MAEPVAQESSTATTSRGRSVAAVVCIFLAALLTLPAAAAFWGQRTINDSQRYLQTVGPLVDSPQVQAAIATKVTEAIQSQVDVEAILKEVFAGVITDRPRLQALVGPMSGAVDGLIESQVNEFVASDAFADFWITANTRAQAALLRLLQGDETGAISLQEDQVVLDISQVIDQVKQRLVARGLIIADRVPIPDTDRQIVLMDAPQLQQARTIYAFANPVAKLLIVLVAALYLAALVLAHRKPRMTVIIGVALAANSLLMALALSIGRQLFVNQLAGTVFGPASRVFYNQLLSYVERGQQVMLALGLLLVAVGWFTSTRGTGAAARATVANGLERVGTPLADGPLGDTSTWVARHSSWVRIVIGILGTIALLWGNDVSLSRLLWSVALVAVLLAGAQVLIGAANGSLRNHTDIEPTTA
ncbi:MAG TPA: hypothetical protein VFL67_11035 [Mycobacterium sp.]|nr:hypothetical protein [Mycobacterium sp.]